MANTINLNDFSNGSLVSNEWTGTGVFDKIMMAVSGNIKSQYLNGRITGAEYANVYTSGLNQAVSEAMKYLLNRQMVEKSLDAKDNEISLQELQITENGQKWTIQKQVMENQLDMSNTDKAYKEKTVLRGLALQDKQIEAAAVDIQFNMSKRDIMEKTRNDNIRSKAAEQFAEFMKYISAANVVPGAQDFKNMRALIRAMNAGISNPNGTATIADTSTTTDDFRTTGVA